jgi:tocopherol O-methyltransferase
MNAANPSAAGPELTAAVERYYDTTVDLYEQLWGEHVHHGYWDPDEPPAGDVASRHAATDRLVHELVRYAGVPTGSRVLDVGCGIGGPALHLAGALGCTVDGVTLSATQAERANEKAREAGLAERARFHHRDGLATGYPDAAFDVVWAVESLMHIADRPAFFTEARRLLRPGGLLVLATWSVRDGALAPDEQDLVDLILRHQVMPSLSSRPAHERMCREAGFTEVAAADWSRAVARTWDPEYALIRPFDRSKTMMMELARARGVDVLGYFHAGPLMKKGFDTGVVTYDALRAVKPVDGTA